MLKDKVWIIFTWVFFTLTAVNIVALIFVDQNIFTAQSYILNAITKPLIMTCAIYFLLRNLNGNKYYILMLVAFTFSLLGDILLIGQGVDQGVDELFFIAGLGAFFIAQGAYIVYFYRSANSWLSLNKLIQALQAIVVLFAFGLYLLMLPHLDDLWILVLLYLTIVATMGIVALGRFGHVNFNAFIYTTIGAFSFVLSDSIIGYNKFVNEIPLAEPLIMTFYCFAQYMILKGFIAFRIPQLSEE